MSYREEFLTLVKQQIGLAPQNAAARNFYRIGQLMEEATIIRMRGDQSAVFLDTPVDPGQDWLTWLRLPFPRIYIQPETPLIFSAYDHGIQEEIARIQADDPRALPPDELDRLLAIERVQSPQVRGIVLAEGTIASLHLQHYHAESPWPTDLPGVDLATAPIARMILTTFLFPVPGYVLNGHTLVMAVLEDGRLATTRYTAQDSTRARMRQWVIHTLNFLSSPTVKLVREEPARELQKARQRRGKPPLPGWYEITYRQHVQDYTRGKVAPGPWHHSYRYDVRGHFRRYERGPLVGRVVWVAPHQRGLRHALYKPKGYRTEPAPSGGGDV
jgi:hypothetical protein